MIVAGFGFRGTATLASLQDALHRAAGGLSIGLIATAADKAKEPCLQDLARLLSVSVASIPPDDLQAVATPTDSATVRRHRGTGSLAEAAALVAAGPGASLLGARAISADRMATCALARRTTP